MWTEREQYPSAPPGGRPLSDGALERRLFMARRNARLQGNDPEAAADRVMGDVEAKRQRIAKVE